MNLVVGATGSLGGKIARAVRAKYGAVRVLVRPETDASALREAGAEVVNGDLTDPHSLERACAGVDAVITTASASNRPGGDVEAVDRLGNQNLIAAAERAGVRKFVFVSTVTASPASPVPVFRAKGLAEEHLRASGLDHTILQAPGFMDVWFPMMIELPLRNDQPVTLVGASRRRHSFIAEADVAAFAIAAVEHPAASNQTLAIGGPEPLTFRDVVRAYEEALGRAIEVRSVAPGDPIPGLPEPVWGIAASLELFDTIVPMEETARRFGVTLTGVGSFARTRLSTLSA
jgi:NADH dehydrogenase